MIKLVLAIYDSYFAAEALRGGSNAPRKKLPLAYHTK